MYTALRGMYTALRGMRVIYNAKYRKYTTVTFDETHLINFQYPNTNKQYFQCIGIFKVIPNLGHEYLQRCYHWRKGKDVFEMLTLSTRDRAGFTTSQPVADYFFPNEYWFYPIFFHEE